MKMLTTSALNEFFIMYLRRWKKVTLILLLIWLVVTYLVISPLRCSNSAGDAQEYQPRLKELTGQLEMLKQQNAQLLTLVKKSG